jgi:S-adenosylmethionine synthetase
MIEKVNPEHPDKIADRIAGAIVDLAYQTTINPKIAVEVLIGHGTCHVIVETSVELNPSKVNAIIQRISGEMLLIDFKQYSQDMHLARNQENQIRCGDNGIFRGVPLTDEQIKLSKIARIIYDKYPYDGKYILDSDKLIICQSNAKTEDLQIMYPNAIINPLGEWTGSTTVDTGATNRKLGSDMADSITGGGLHGKDLSKADVSVNIYAFLKAQETGQQIEISCAIGDEFIDGKPYSEIVSIAKEFIDKLGGFEKFAEWGLY